MKSRTKRFWNISGSSFDSVQSWLESFVVIIFGEVVILTVPLRSEGCEAGVYRR